MYRRTHLAWGYRTWLRLEDYGSYAFGCSFDDSVLPVSACGTACLSSVVFPSWFPLVCCFASAMRFSKSGFCTKYFLMASSTAGDETAGLAGVTGTIFFDGMSARL